MDSKSETTPKSAEVSSETKFSVLTEVAHEIGGQADIALSGSTAYKIAQHLDGDKSILSPAELTSVGDIDLVTIPSVNKPGLKGLKIEAGVVGFGVEVNPIYLSSVYSGRHRDKVIKRVDLQLGDVVYSVQYTSPEFLLLSLINQGATDKTPPEKLKRKMSELVNSPLINIDVVRELAQYESHCTHQLNRDTFNQLIRLWRDELKISGSNLDNLLDIAQDNLPSTVNLASLRNILKKPADLDGLTYDDVVQQTNFERFFEEFGSKE